MSIYEDNRAKLGETPHIADGVVRSGYRPGWVWLPIAVLLLLTILVVGVGFIYGDYNARTRAYDNGTRLEQSGGDTTMPGLPTPFPNPNPPESGADAVPARPPVFPEDGLPLANDGQ